MNRLKYYTDTRKFLERKYPKFFSCLLKYAQYIKYLLVGITATVIHLTTLYIFHELLDIIIIFATSLAFIIAFIFSFSMQKLWTFRNNKRDISKQLSLYFLAAILALTLNASFMYLLVEIFELWYLIAQVFVTLFIALYNFFIYKHIIFSIKK